MTENHRPYEGDTEESLEDRLAEQALFETVGGKRPPDLLQRIMAAASLQPPARQHVFGRPRVRLALAASLLVALGLGAAWYATSKQRAGSREVAWSSDHRRGFAKGLEKAKKQTEMGELPGNSSSDWSAQRGTRMAQLSQEGDEAAEDEETTATSPGYTVKKPTWTTKSTVFSDDADTNSRGGIRGELLKKSGGSPANRPDAAGAGVLVGGRGLPGAGGEGAMDGAGGGMPGGGQMPGGGAGGAGPMAGGGMPGAAGLQVGARRDGRPISIFSSKPAEPNEYFDGDPGLAQPLGPRMSVARGFNLSGDRYSRIVENEFLKPIDHPLSTFSIDVDTASYAKVRRYLTEGSLPPPDAVRLEEMINYFSYDYAQPDDDHPFAAHVEVAACPWRPGHRLVRIGLKGREIAAENRPASNLVFLLDVSGSMQPDDRLPRVRRAMRLLVEQLREQDHVAIVVYAGASGLVLPTTPGFRRDEIVSALENLEAGGSTNGAAGIELAYQMATSGFIEGGTNRVILCTDGDFNVGTTSTADLERMAEQKAKSGVFLSVLGFGMGNHNDDMLEKLADKGNGNYAYIDSEQEGRKVLVDEVGATLVTIAKDVKIQIEFNPGQVAAYRLIGYENRLLAAEDFNNDAKDAGEIGAGHSVTALYEIVPAGEGADVPEVDRLRYQKPAEGSQAGVDDKQASGEMLTLKLKYKRPDAKRSGEALVHHVTDEGRPFAQASADFKFAAAVASFGMLLRQSEHKGDITWDGVLEIAQEGVGRDLHEYRSAFLQLVRQAKALSGG